MQRASSVGATFLMYIMQNSVCPPCGGGTLKCSCRKELGDQLQLVRSMLSEIAERSDTCHTMTDVTTIGDLRCECACGVQLVPETSAALFIKRTGPRTFSSCLVLKGLLFSPPHSTTTAAPSHALVH